MLAFAESLDENFLYESSSKLPDIGINMQQKVKGTLFFP